MANNAIGPFMGYLFLIFKEYPNSQAVSKFFGGVTAGFPLPPYDNVTQSTTLWTPTSSQHKNALVLEKLLFNFWYFIVL